LGSQDVARSRSGGKRLTHVLGAGGTAYERGTGSRDREQCSIHPHLGLGTVGSVGLGTVGRATAVLPSCPRGARLSLTLCEQLTDELPIRQSFDHGLNEARTLVLVIQIVSVLPHIARPERTFAVGQRIVGIVSRKIGR